MLDKLLTRGLLFLVTLLLTVFGFVVWLDLINVLFGPLDEIIYGFLVAFMGWAMIRIKRLGQQGKV